MKQIDNTHFEWDLVSERRDELHLASIRKLKLATLGMFFLALFFYTWTPEKVLKKETSLASVEQSERKAVVVTHRIKPISTYRAAMLTLKYCEGLRLGNYKCPAGVDTNGWGATKNGKTQVTLEEANGDVKRSYQKCFTYISKTYPCYSINERHSLAVFYYNVGRMGVSLKKKLKAYENPTDIMALYIRHKIRDKDGNIILNADGSAKMVISDGLKKRREKEIALFNAYSDEELGAIITDLQPKVQAKITKQLSSI